MKGVVFTIDAIFSLVIALAIISLVIYFGTVASFPILNPVYSLSSLASSLSSTYLYSLSSISPIFAQISSQQEASSQYWNSEYGNNYASFSPQGPSYPFIQFIYFVNGNIITSPVEAYGNVYVATTNSIYAVNASFGSLSWSSSSSNILPITPTIYDGLIYLFNSTYLLGFSAYSGSKIFSIPLSSIFHSSGIFPSTPLYLYEGMFIFGATNGYLYGLNPSTGSLAFSSSLGAIPQFISFSGGEIFVSTESFSSIGLELLNNQLVELWHYSYSSQPPVPSPLDVHNTYGFATGNGNVASFISTAGSLMFSANLNGNIKYVASNGNGFFFQTNGGGAYIVYTYPYFYEAWTFSTSLSPISAALTNETAYSLWSGGYLMSQNLSNGVQNWIISLPYSSSNMNLSLGYGMLFVSDGNALIGYGSCPVTSNYTLLQAVASLYASSHIACGTAMLDYFYPSSNYTVEINYTYMPSQMLPNFNGGYIYVPSSPQTNIPGPLSITAWVSISTQTQEGTILGKGNQYMLFYDGSAGGLRFEINNSVQTCGNPQNGGSTYPLTPGKWYFIAAVYSANVMNLYINGNKEYSIKVPCSSIYSSNAPLTIGSSNGTNLFHGSIADVQIYYYPLSSSQIYGLYYGGISAPPMQGNNAWYLLEGDTNDYSKYEISGYPINIFYSSSPFKPQSLVNSYSVTSLTQSMPINNKYYNVSVVGWK
ncbi:MAG: LamG-like jellyroll fold domain-containing protein [Candidatus Micrarchaeaceae archaeon]